MDCLSISDSHGSNKRDNTIWQQAGCSEEDGETQTFPGGTLCGLSANVFTCLREDDWCSAGVCTVQLYSSVYSRRRAAGQCVGCQ